MRAAEKELPRGVNLLKAATGIKNAALKSSYGVALAKGTNWKQGRQKDLAADIVVVALEALGLGKEMSPT